MRPIDADALAEKLKALHGHGTALWASEIEEFPMAVTKVRFPET